MMTTHRETDAQACIRDAQTLLQHHYAQLPTSYFDGKDAGHFLFNNIVRLIERYPVHPQTSSDSPVEALVHEQLLAADTTSLYSGVPWCEQICSFCNFAYSTSMKGDVHDLYLANISAELNLYLELGLPKVNSVYFGGGTPTALDDERFERYLNSVLGALNLVPNASVTCEATVSTLTGSKLEVMRRSGVTRLSMGVQSLDDTVRERARLLRSGQEVIETVTLARSYFDIFNADLIYGYPYQSPESWYDTIARIAELELPSLTLYRLEVKERTSDLKAYQHERSSFQEEITARLQYFIAQQVLEAHGYVENPLGWWIRQDKHVGSLTWKQHMAGWAKAIPYIGIGQGAFSLCGGAYYENHKVLQQWSSNIERGRLPVASCRTLPPQVSFVNRILRVLRTARGITLSDLAEDLDALKLGDSMRDVLERNLAYGLLERREDEYHLTLAGRSLIHWMLDEIVTECFVS